MPWMTAMVVFPSTRALSMRRSRVRMASLTVCPLTSTTREPPVGRGERETGGGGGGGGEDDS